MVHIFHMLSFFMSIILSIILAGFIGIKTQDTYLDIIAIPVIFMVSHGCINGFVINGLLFKKYIKQNTSTFDYNDLQGTISSDEEIIIIPWSEVAKIEIITTDEGLWNEDFWWLFHLHDKQEPVFMAQGVTDHVKIFEALEKHFASVNYEQIGKALGSTSNTIFHIWQ